MNILVVCDHFYPEEFIINDLAREWSRNGHNVNVLTQNPAYPLGKIFQGYRNKIFQVTFWDEIKINRVYTVPGFKKSLGKKILNYLCFPVLGTIRILSIVKKTDLIFLYQVGPLTQAIPALVAKLATRKKIAIWTGDLWPDTVYAYGFKKTRILSFVLDNLVRVTYKNCDLIFIPSFGFKKVLNKYLPDRKFIFAPNWCVKQDNVSDDAVLFLSNKVQFTFAGNIGKVQNLNNVISGFEKALKRNSEMALNFVGDGSFLPDLKKIAEESNISNIKFWGRQPSNQMYQYFNASDFLIISLDPDPVYDLYIPSKFQTYLNTGKPILCIMSGEVAELVSRYDIGVVARPEDIDDIAEKFLICAAMTGERRTALGNSAIRLLNDEFDRGKIIADMTNEMQKLIVKAKHQ